ncbi:hypothetical protein FA15DRAFT_757255 [Coprinopsis marcescibilis]|uniref:Telomere-associated protein Rif1 N-terminal domain-containing protein n=1 Tax=Coprinopsis marcescibilis TaxID=230819 RepID=A0A5C3KT12_COPMA|nr:hypothetical protein FA15DRAFT_757255 [Coprinopsis marcescibilis]
MSLLTPPSTSHRSEKENSSKFSFAFSLNVDPPKLTVSVGASSEPTATSLSCTPPDAQMDTPSSASSSRSVVWSTHNSYHSLNTPPKARPSAAATNAMVKDRPIKPILKRRKLSPLSDATNDSDGNVGALLSIPQDLDTFFRQRESTPEPSDPLCNLNYLDYPVSLIIKPDAKLRELAEGYSVLNARLRGHVQYSTNADASWPLFQPLRKNREAFVECIERDLKRAFVDPINSVDCPKSDDDALPSESWDEEETPSLPSPKKTPKKAKKKGMSAEQVKFARDLCSISHSVIKLLCVLLCFPAIHGVFEPKQLRSMLASLLAIPLADKIPTPNARKTCALAILVIQCQRLPEEILLPTRDRIALALKRGIDGELGKEGKKGSANDGLKAIGDLSIYQPSTFVPVFTKATILPAVLSNLLAPTLSLRLQACYALGGIAYALAGLPTSNIHAIASDFAAEFINAPSPPTPSRKASPNKSAIPIASPIIRTLRTTMSTQDATHIAQSPVWSLCVSASLIVLLGSKMWTDKRISRLMIDLLKPAYAHGKKSIRHLGFATWRTVNWAWFQPDYDQFKQDDADSEREDEDVVVRRHTAVDKRAFREAYFTTIQDRPDGGAAMGLIVALLSMPSSPIEGTDEDDALRRTLSTVQAMANSSDSDTVSDAAMVLVNLVTAGQDPSTGIASSFANNTRGLLPRCLFAQPPTNSILNADLSLSTGGGSLLASVRTLFDKQPSVDDVRPLRAEEMRKEWVWDSLLKSWKSVLSAVELTDTVEIPTDVLQTWESLIISSVGLVQDDRGDTTALASRVVNVLVDVLTDPELEFTFKPPTSLTPKEQELAAMRVFTNCEYKVAIVKKLWSSVKTAFPRGDLGGAASQLLRSLLDNRGVLSAPRKKKVRTLSGTNNVNSIAPMGAWAKLCATLIVDCGNGENEAADVMKTFWGIGLDDAESKAIRTAWENDEMKSSVWKTCVTVWTREQGNWEGGAVLLAVPFLFTSGSSEWSISSEDTAIWKELYQYASSKALDYGMDSSSTTVIDSISQLIVANSNSVSASPASLIQASDLLLDHLEASEMREVPVDLVDLLNATLKSTYPVEENNLSRAGWFVQALTRVFENCPKELIREFVEGVAENLTVWLKDEDEVWSEDHLDFTFLPLYQHLLLRIQPLPKDLEFLYAISPLLDSVFSGRAMPTHLRNHFQEAFQQFWQMSPYGSSDEPVEGWPRAIRHCLGLEEDAEDIVIREVPATPSRTSTKGKGRDQVFPRTPMVAMNGSNIPSPRRPHKAHADSDQFYPPLPVDRSPLSPMRRRRISSSSSAEARFTAVSALGASPFGRNGGIRFPGVESPSKRRRSLDQEEENAGEKENSSPLHASPKRRRTGLLSSSRPPALLFDLAPPMSVHDRIMGASPEKKKTKLREKMGVKVKRVVRDVGPVSVFDLGAAKPRSRSASPAPSEASSQSSNDSEDERVWVERELVPFPSYGSTTESGTPAVEQEEEEEQIPVEVARLAPQTPPKKRKRMIMESVLIPASEMLEVSRAKARRKLESAASLDSVPTAATIQQSTSAIPESWRTPLSSRTLLKRSVTGPLPIPGTAFMTKVRLRRSASLKFEMEVEGSKSTVVAGNDDPFEMEVMTTEPLPALRIQRHEAPRPVVRNISRLVKEDSSSDTPSSDDSQHLGQVTPHHLISPELTRVSRVYSSSRSKVLTPTTVGSSGSKLSATSQILKAERGGVDVLGSDDSVDGGPQSSPTKMLAERRKLLLFERTRQVDLKTAFKALA